MTRAEYLRERGWTGGAKDWWIDPRYAGYPYALDTGAAPTVRLDDAVTIQRARDAKERRKAWVAFAAATATSGSTNPKTAVAWLAEYDAQFGAPATFSDEVTP